MSVASARSGQRRVASLRSVVCRPIPGPRHVALHLEGGTCLPGIETNDFEPGTAEFVHEPWRHRSGLDPYAGVFPRMPVDQNADSASESALHRSGERHIRLRSRALSGSFAWLLGAGTAGSLIQIEGSLIPKRGVGQHAVNTALPLGGDNGLDRSVCRLSMPYFWFQQSLE
jgi:hypothetical protein